MRALRPIVQFLVLSIVIYVLLIVRWPGVRETYRDAYLFTADLLFGHYGDEGIVLFKEYHKDQANDAKITMGKRGVPVGLPVVINTGQVGYTPTAELIALILATPLSWKRRGVSLLFGFVLVNAFVMGRLWLLLIFGYMQDAPGRLYDPGPFWKSLISWCHEYFFLAPEGSFVVPALIWALVVFSREDIKELIQRTQLLVVSAQTPAVDEKKGVGP